MRFTTALALAAGVHAVALVLLWRSWPPPSPEGEVVPLELRSAEPPPVPAPVAPAVEAPASAGAGGGGGGKRRASRMVISLQPEPGGDVPAGSPAPAAAASQGTGVGNGVGPGVGDGDGPASVVAAVKPVVDHGPLRAQAMERIRRQKRYPELARRRRLEGTVIVAFRVAPDGGVAGVRIKQGVDEMLDQAALDAVRAAVPLPAALAADGELEVPFQFSLRP